MTLKIVGIGGSVRSDSQSERTLWVALQAAEKAGAEVQAITGNDLALPFYDPFAHDREPRAQALVEALRDADGVVISSPGYHGTISGLVKNALDYVEDLREDERPYLEGRAVGCIGTAYGWQAAVTTLQALRSVVHALRGWPTPMGMAVNSAAVTFGPLGEEPVGLTAASRAVNSAGEAGPAEAVHAEAVKLGVIGRQVVDFAREQAGISTE